MNTSFIKFIVLSVLVVGSIFAFVGCERIDAGHVGVKVNLYGDGKGVDDVTEVTGWVFYNPISTKIVEFPTFMQHKEDKKIGDVDIFKLAKYQAWSTSVVHLKVVALTISIVTL